MGRGEERRVAELVGLVFAWDELEAGYRFRTVGRADGDGGGPRQLHFDHRHECLSGER